MGKVKGRAGKEKEWGRSSEGEFFGEIYAEISGIGESGFGFKYSIFKELIFQIGKKKPRDADIQFKAAARLFRTFSKFRQDNRAFWTEHKLHRTAKIFKIIIPSL